MKTQLTILFAGLFAMNSYAALHTEAIEYKQGDTTLEGYLAYDDGVKGPRPGVLVVHDWLGCDSYAKMRADMLAKLGYVAFAADIYGKGVRPKDPREAGGMVGKYKGDRTLLRARVNAALDVLEKQPQVDPKRIAAIGYCFGGTTVLELARSGADVAGIVTFHGGLDTPTRDAKNIKCKVLLCQGADDPYVPAADVAALQDELRSAKVDWQMIYYSGAVHSFTRPDAGNDNSKGAAYNEHADKRSWEAMKEFFAEIFR
ncbi:MAG TPA: dienelactone hydrolase family protein [Verrucomicrobiae bacterium]|nr:dienelactone hydrolase family protein [Verrucomicrobiae bacterium]